MMYDELINALRRLSDWSIMDFEDNLSYANQIAEEAADAIEELSKRVPVPPHGALMDRDDFFATCPELVDGYKRITDDLVVIPASEEGE